MASGEGQSTPSTSGDAGRDHHEDFGNEYGPLLPTQEELREMEHRRLVGEATNLMLNFVKDPKLAKYMLETAFQDVQAQLKATTTSPPKPDSKKQYSEKELEAEIDARLARILGAQKQGKKHDRKRKKSTDFPGYLVIPPFMAAVDKALSYLDQERGIFGISDFYTSLKHDIPSRQHGFFSRWFWQAIFDLDNIDLGPARRQYLEHHLEQVFEENSCGGIPYVPLLKVPHYIWLGKKRIHRPGYAENGTASAQGYRN
ncbi:hypothetical protein L7F22_039841 [Adiantum nelumboides]|nr:hypothetical protein [Adiantum nelumboides]